MKSLVRQLVREGGPACLVLIFILILAAVPASAQIQNIVATSGASFDPGVPPPGSIAAIFCTGLTGIDGLVSATQIPLPLRLGGVSVTIGGAPAPIFAIANLNDASGTAFQQINVQVPDEAASAAIVIQQGSQTGSVAPAFRSPASPGEFFRNVDGTGIFQHNADYSLVTAQNPAQSGEPIIGYLTGVDSPPLAPTNTPAAFSPLAIVNQYSDAASASLYYVTIGNQNVTPSFFGLAPGLIGVMQVNFALPAISPGLQKVQLLHYTCSGNFHGTCGPNNGNPATIFSTAVTIPVQ